MPFISSSIFLSHSLSTTLILLSIALSILLGTESKLLALKLLPPDHGMGISGIEERRFFHISIVLFARSAVIVLALNDAFMMARMIPMASIFIIIRPKRSL